MPLLGFIESMPLEVIGHRANPVGSNFKFAVGLHMRIRDSNKFIKLECFKVITSYTEELFVEEVLREQLVLDSYRLAVVKQE